MITPPYRVWHKEFDRWLTNNDFSLHCSSNWFIDIFTGKIADVVTGVSDHAECSLEHDKGWYIKKAKLIKESPFVIQRWSGLVDSKGKPIYEGDILKVNGALYDRDTRDDEPIGNFEMKFQTDGKTYADWSTYWLKNYPCEIIGNNIENPEIRR